jgi:hypothetical protein
LQRPARQHGEAIAQQKQQKKQHQTDDRPRHRHANPAHEGLAGQLTQQDEAEARDHESTSRATTALTPSGG